MSPIGWLLALSLTLLLLSIATIPLSEFRARRARTAHVMKEPPVSHICPGGCGRQRVPEQKLACLDCWRRLPDSIKRLINASYGRNFERHRAAVLEATRWFRSNPR